MKTKTLLLLYILPFIILSCEMDEGIGGKTLVHGKVWVKDYNSSFTEVMAEYPAMEIDVYIVYGNDISFSDRTRTDYNGIYKFSYLRPGKYKVYVYSKDPTLETNSPEMAVIEEFEVVKNTESKEIPDLVIAK